jgi:predicted GNAT family N-acyltransferase
LAGGDLLQKSIVAEGLGATARILQPEVQCLLLRIGRVLAQDELLHYGVGEPAAEIDHE